MDPTIRLPASVPETLQAQATGAAVAVEPRDAATVVLVRDGRAPGQGQVQIHLMRRQTTMAFAAGMAVFPGGGVDERDYDADISWGGPTVEDWARTLATTATRARALVCAAVRETFEECGVLLAGEADGSVLADTSGDGWERDRALLADHTQSLADVLRARGLVLRTDLLRAWSLWTTPEFERRRYRSWFFLAVLPDGQQTRDVSTESVTVEWVSIDDAIRRADSREMLMLPPQYSTCLDLYGFAGTAEIMAADKHPEHISPTVGSDDEGAFLLLPQRLVTLGRSIGRQMYPS